MKGRSRAVNAVAEKVLQSRKAAFRVVVSILGLLVATFLLLLWWQDPPVSSGERVVTLFELGVLIMIIVCALIASGLRRWQRRKSACAQAQARR